MPAFTLLAALALQAGATEPSPAVPDDEVVVTGRADALERFVEGLTAAPQYDNLPRWNKGSARRRSDLRPLKPPTS